MINQRVLVAGATGRLGVVVNVLLDRGHSVRAMTRLAPVYFMENLFNPWNRRLRRLCPREHARHR